MLWDEFEINSAEGVYLCSDYKLDNRTYRQGYRINAEDVIIFKMHGIKRVYGAIAETDDLDKRTALGIIAAKICGNNTAYIVDKSDQIQIIANCNGGFFVSEERIRKFNELHHDIILNTISPNTLVNKGDVIARLELTTPLLSQADVDDIVFRLSGNTSLLQISVLKPQKTALMYAKILDDEAENVHFTEQVTQLVSSLNGYGLDFVGEYNTEYYQDKIADKILDVIDDGYDVLFIFAASRFGSRNDVISSALKQVVDDIILGHAPQINVSDFQIARKRNTKIIVVPHNYDKDEHENIDRLIWQSILTDSMTIADFSHICPATLNKGAKLAEEYADKVVATKNQVSNNKKANIAAVVLAAGIGSRSGRNKLMVEDKNGIPLFMKSVNAAIASNACPVFVITGYHHDDMSEYLNKVDVNVIYNPAYRSGIKTSIDLGLKSVPDFCDGAMIIPADMPNLKAPDLNKLISSFKKDTENQLCVFSHKGVKHNPLIWSKSLYDKADIVPENSHLRAVFVEHSDYTNLVNIKDEDKFLDVNFPSDIEKISNV